jgi:hypothetical protein
MTADLSESDVARDDAALDRELREVMEGARKRASRIRQPSDVWGLEQYLTQRRKEINHGTPKRLLIRGLENLLLPRS